MKKIITILLILLSFNNFAQNPQLAKYKAMFTLNFIRYIGWPEAATKGDFIIGVLNDKDIAQFLQQKSAGKKFGYQNIVVKTFRKVDDITDCQILFFSDKQSFSKHAETVKQKLNGKNSLIITNTEGATKKGAMINFVIRGGKLKFEISQSNAEAFGIKFSSSLMSLSNVILK
jgi:hypothetical protein